MALSAVLSAAGACAAFAALRHLAVAGPTYVNLVDNIDRADARKLVIGVHGGLMIHAAICVTGVVVLAPLSLALRRRSRLVRPFAWGAAVLLTAALAFMIGTDTQASLPGNINDAVSRAEDNLIAGWYPVLTSFLVAAQLAAMIAFAVLLLQASATAFYDTRDSGTEVWTLRRGPEGT
jgi:hypothetical protein